MDKYLKIQQGSYMSLEIYDADHRGDLAYGTAHAVVLAWAGKEFQPQAAATTILLTEAAMTAERHLPPAATVNNRDIKGIQATY